MPVRVEAVTLHIHRATASDQLADGLAELLAAPLPDPFAQEVVAVPAKGVERWLAQRLSHRLGASAGLQDGICAGVRFLNPHSLVALILGIDRDDPWHPDRLAWAVLRAIDESVSEPWAATLAQHLGHTGADDDVRRGRRYAVARRLAGLFSSYAQQRPSVVADWRAGGSSDGAGHALEEDLAWQAHLWRRVLELVDAPAPDLRLTQVVAALQQPQPRSESPGPGLQPLDLPGRLSLFGHTRIAAGEMQLIAALAEQRDVHLWLPQASPAAWDAIAAEAAAGPVPRIADRCVELVHHPLLAGLGRDARELQRILALAGGVDHLHGAEFAFRAERGGGTGEEATAGSDTTLLHLLQSDLRHDAVPTDVRRADRIVPTCDRSIQVHACHGSARQVEVLREVVTGLLENDPTLEPRDILVMCPDIDDFAPLVHAGFGLSSLVGSNLGHSQDHGHSRGGDGLPEERAGHPAHRLRVSLADRAPRQTNPLLELAARLVTLAGGRLTSGEVLDLARTAPVRRRFRFGDDDLDRMADWVRQVAVRWGLDEEHRGDYALSRFGQNTWQAGLARIMVGAALDGRDHDHLGTTLALDDLDSGDIDLAGRLAEFLDRLGSTLKALRRCSPASDWTASLRQGVLGLADVGSRDAWQLTQFTSELARIDAAAARAGESSSLRLADVHALLAEQLAGRATRANFRTGTLTVCTMTPMRSVPHRVVCLVGLDDGVFPRVSTPDGDDVLARAPMTGERDARSEDRQLLLDAIMSARDTLVITYTGADEHTGATRPPAVPLGELIDAIDATATASDGGAVTGQVLVRHPLQSYDPRNLGAKLDRSRDGAGGRPLPGGAPFSFDPSALAGARAALSPRTDRGLFEGLRLPAVAARDVALDDLTRFLRHPAQDFLRSRLGLVLSELPETPSEGIPIELDGLETWHIGDRMLRGVLAGRSLEDCRNAELWRGELPPGALGRRILDDVTTRIQGLASTGWTVLGTGAPGHPAHVAGFDVDIDLPSPAATPRHLSGTVTGVTGIEGLDGGHPRSVEITYSTVRAAHRLRSWVRALALNAAGREGATSHIVGQGRRGRRKVVVHYCHGPVPPEVARQRLAELVGLRDRGLREPLPIPVATAAAWASAYLDRDNPAADPFGAADREWATGDGAANMPRGEQDDPAHVRIYGRSAPLTTILGEPREDEMWFPGVRGRLGQLALRIWQPLLTSGAERIEEV